MSIHFKDKLNIIKSYRFRRTWNALRVKSSYLVTKITRQPIVWGLPISASIEPTTACNLKCPECPSGLRQFSRDTGNIAIDNGKTYIDQLAPSVGYINFYFQGEPLISPHFFDLVRYATDKGIYTATSTNAHFLDKDNCQKIIDSGLKRLIISIDGTQQETYASYRKEGTLAKVIEGTKNMIAVKKKNNGNGPHIIFQFLVVSTNEHQINDLFKLAKELKIDEVRLKTAQFYDFENGNALMPENERYSRYKKMPNGKYKLKGKQANHCWRMWSSGVITWDGNMVPCCFDKDAKYTMGNLLQRPLKSIWHDAAYKNFRSQVLKNRRAIDICANCSEGTKVWS